MTSARTTATVASAVYIAASGTVGLAYQVQGQRMPEWLFHTIVWLGVPVIGISALVWAVSGIFVAVPWAHSRIIFQWPVIRRKPFPYGWLLRIQHDDYYNPVSRLLVEKSHMGKMSAPESRRQFVPLSLLVRNGGVHDVLIEAASGRARYGGGELPDAVESELITHRMSRWEAEWLTFRVYLPVDVAEELRKEVADRKSIRTLDLRSVKFRVKADYDDAPWMDMPIQSEQSIFWVEDR